MSDDKNNPLDTPLMTWVFSFAFIGICAVFAAASPEGVNETGAMVASGVVLSVAGWFNWRHFGRLL